MFERNGPLTLQLFSTFLYFSMIFLYSRMFNHQLIWSTYAISIIPQLTSVITGHCWETFPDVLYSINYLDCVRPPQSNLSGQDCRWDFPTENMAAEVLIIIWSSQILSQHVRGIACENRVSTLVSMNCLCQWIILTLQLSFFSPDKY